MDLYIFNLINGLAKKWAWLDGLGVFLATKSEYILLLIIAVFVFLKIKKRWRMGAVAFASALVSRYAICSAIRMLWFRPRPFVLNSVNLLVNYDAKEASFPSAHASFYFALSTVIYLNSKKLGIFSYVFTFFMTLSRVFTGIHWPSDILAGALIGIIIGFLGNWIFVKFTKKTENSSLFSLSGC